MTSHTSIQAKLKEKQAALEVVKQAAPQLVATHSVRASKLIEELTSLEGKARAQRLAVMLRPPRESLTVGVGRSFTPASAGR